MPLLIFLVVSLLAGLTAAVVLRYLKVKKLYAPSDAPEAGFGLPPEAEVDLDGFVGRLSQMIQIPTVSWTDRSKRDLAQFTGFQESLTRMYPKVHAALEQEVMGPFGLIYRWPGSDPGRKPALFLAHYDVVPAAEEGDESWQEPPFSGKVKDGMLWGRGAIDIKCQLAFLMETAETLLATGWQPKRDLYFAFGGDEEIAGTEGALNMADHFKQQGLEFEFVLDEGGIIAKDQMAFLKDGSPALVGVSEKGMATFKITASGESGHSSMPSREGTAIGQLSRGVARLEKHPFPSRIDPVVQNMLERFVPYVSLGLGMVFANLWLFGGLIKLIFAKNKGTDALIRTTQAVTVFHSGEQENVLPAEAFCLINHRILPGDTIEGVMARNKKVIDDPGLGLSDAGNWPPNNPLVAPGITGSGFERIKRVLAKTHPGVIAVPFLVTGSTDSKYYKDLTGQILRFTPLALTPGDVETIHGVNEKVSLENLENGLNFYIQLFLHL